MQMAEEGGTPGEAVVLTRKAMAGMTIAYGSNSESDMQPPMDPNAPTAMEVNALHKRERRGGKNPTVVVEARVTDEVIDVSRTMQEAMVNANLKGRMAKMM